jgi:hypothetical protein
MEPTSIFFLNWFKKIEKSLEPKVLDIQKTIIKTTW